MPLFYYVLCAEATDGLQWNSSILFNLMIMNVQLPSPLCLLRSSREMPSHLYTFNHNWRVAEVKCSDNRRGLWAAILEERSFKGGSLLVYGMARDRSLIPPKSHRATRRTSWAFENNRCNLFSSYIHLFFHYCWMAALCEYLLNSLGGCCTTSNLKGSRWNMAEDRRRSIDGKELH